MIRLSFALLGTLLLANDAAAQLNNIFGGSGSGRRQSPTWSMIDPSLRQCLSGHLTFRGTSLEALAAQGVSPVDPALRPLMDQCGGLRTTDTSPTPDMQARSPATPSAFRASMTVEQRFAVYLERLRIYDASTYASCFGGATERIQCARAKGITISATSDARCTMTVAETLAEPSSRRQRWDGQAAPYIKAKELTFSLAGLDEALISRSGESFELYFLLGEQSFSSKIKLSDGNDWISLPLPPMIDGNRSLLNDSPRYRQWVQSVIDWQQRSASEHPDADIRGFTVTMVSLYPGRLYLRVTTPSIGLGFWEPDMPKSESQAIIDGFTQTLKELLSTCKQ